MESGDRCADAPARANRSSISAWVLSPEEAIVPLCSLQHPKAMFGCNFSGRSEEAMQSPLLSLHRGKFRMYYRSQSAVEDDQQPFSPRCHRRTGVRSSLVSDPVSGTVKNQASPANAANR
jgi:hypothetical protein